MSYLPANDVFFIPNVRMRPHEGGLAMDNVARAPSDHFQSGVFLHKGQAMPFFISYAKHQRNVVAGLTGMNVSDVLDVSDLRQMNARGTTFIWMPLPKPVRGVPINETAKDFVRAFLTSQQSPVNSMFPTHIPKFIATHSTSGRIVMDLLHEPESAKKLSYIFSGAVYASPYLDTANASMLFNPGKDRIFQIFANSCKDSTPHETRLGRLYMLRTAKNESYRETSSAGMAYSHILELQNAGRNLIRNFNAQAANTLPSIIVIGDRDPFACSRTTSVIAKRMGVEPIIVKGGQHYPFRQDASALRHVIDSIDLWTHNHEKQRASIEYISSDEFLGRTKPRTAIDEDLRAADQVPAHAENIFRSLGDRLGGALQRSASFLNPAAGIF